MLEYIKITVSLFVFMATLNCIGIMFSKTNTMPKIVGIINSLIIANAAICCIINIIITPL